MEITGYYKEYYSGSTYIGRQDCKLDREQIGYRGKQKHIAEQDIKIGRKKIKKGQPYFTLVYPYNGNKVSR